MNQKTAYEQIITGKLQTLPVPDMADAIWARIEAQLDLDMPTDDALPPNDAPRFPTGGTIIGGISALLLTVLISYFFLQKNTNNSIPFQQPTNATTAPLQKGPETFNQAPSLPQKQKEKVISPPIGTGFQPPSLDSSTSATPLVTTGIIDTATYLPVAIAAPVVTPQKKDTVLPVKKGRGVAGITDNDYRIVPKKDSTN